jgi:hypothetical protein
MPVKSRVSKRRPWTVSDEVLDAFKTARATEHTYFSCRPEVCAAPSPNEHCQTCRDYLEAGRVLHRLLGLQPWRPCVTDVSDPEEDPEVFEMRQQIEARLAERG